MIKRKNNTVGFQEMHTADDTGKGLLFRTASAHILFKSEVYLQPVLHALLQMQNIFDIGFLGFRCHRCLIYGQPAMSGETETVKAKSYCFFSHFCRCISAVTVYGMGMQVLFHGNILTYRERKGNYAAAYCQK